MWAMIQIMWCKVRFVSKCYICCQMRAPDVSQQKHYKYSNHVTRDIRHVTVYTCDTLDLHLEFNSILILNIVIVLIILPFLIYINLLRCWIGGRKQERNIENFKIFGSRCFYLDIFAENVLTSKGNLYNFNTAPAS